MFQNVLLNKSKKELPVYITEAKTSNPSHQGKHLLLCFRSHSQARNPNACFQTPAVGICNVDKKKDLSLPEYLINKIKVTS